MVWNPLEFGGVPTEFARRPCGLQLSLKSDSISLEPFAASSIFGR
jgi:hypothetical protein